MEIGTWLLRQRNLLRRLSWWTIGAGMGMLLIGFAGILDWGWQYPKFFSDSIIILHSRLSTELIGIGITVIFIDTANQFREIQRDKNSLIKKMGNRDNRLALQAVDELREAGWLQDGSLRGVYLGNARLQNAVLVGADLQGAIMNEGHLQQVTFGSRLLSDQPANLRKAVFWNADIEEAILIGCNLYETNLSGANLGNARLDNANLQRSNFLNTDLKNAYLRGANLGAAIHLTDVQLAQANSLHRAIMPGGELYDGRFNLVGDVADALESNLDTGDAHTMAIWYGVETDIYLRGQQQTAHSRVRE